MNWRGWIINNEFIISASHDISLDSEAIVPEDAIVPGHYRRVLPYIGNFSRVFNFRWVCDLPEIAKNRHSEK